MPTLFLCTLHMHSEVHLLHVQVLCNMSTQLGGACRVLLDHVYTPGRHTDDYWRVVQLELCSCSCLPAVLVAATCTGFVQDVHTARYTLIAACPT
jgi:hypothetical protein